MKKIVFFVLIIIGLFLYGCGTTEVDEEILVELFSDELNGDVKTVEILNKETLCVRIVVVEKISV